MEEMDQVARSMQRKDGRALRLVRLGQAYHQALRLDDASRCAHEALKFSRDHLERGNEAYALRLLGELGVNDPAAHLESETFLRQAITRAEELKLRPLLAHCYLTLSTLCHRAGQSAEAESYLSAALALFRTLDVPFWLERARGMLSSPR